MNSKKFQKRTFFIYSIKEEAEPRQCCCCCQRQEGLKQAHQSQQEMPSFLNLVERARHVLTFSPPEDHHHTEKNTSQHQRANSKESSSSGLVSLMKQREALFIYLVATLVALNEVNKEIEKIILTPKGAGKNC